MELLRIRAVEALEPFHLRLTLTDGSVIERDVGPLLQGPVFDVVRTDPQYFQQVKAEDGTVVWPNGADLCPDVLIWSGMPPGDASSNRLPADLSLTAQP